MDISRAVGITEATSAWQDRCTAFNSTFTTDGLTSISAEYLSAGSIVPVPEVCGPLFAVIDNQVTTPTDLCYVVLNINTTRSSTTRLEFWLPNDWNSRIFATGTGGLSGCVDFPGLNWGTSLGFAAVGTNAGHDGPSAKSFYQAPEVFTDYNWRAIHVEAVVSKAVMAAYYEHSASHSYFNACSVGGRQAFHAAENFPDDFDGIIACAPAVNMVNAFGWFGLAAQPFLTGKPGEMKPADWAVLHKETLRQCDALDGKIDNTIAHPEECNFDPTKLICSKRRPAPDCLNAAQVAGLKTLYSDIRDEKGQLVYPRFVVGAENGGAAQNLMRNTQEFFQYAVYDPTYDGKNFSVRDIEYARQILPNETNTWTGDLTAFKQRGGKLIHVHGTEDSVLPTGISTLQYEMTRQVTGARDIDSWYAMYLVPGLNHCVNTNTVATGPWRFGQYGAIPEPRVASNSSEYNALLAVVDWVEKGIEPKRLVGMTDQGETREVCRYPSQGRWVHDQWVC
ncbi:Tannase/feruloyl esterase, partial [Auriculariales sp. MPI-PUGE-AT-0066]